MYYPSILIPGVFFIEATRGAASPSALQEQAESPKTPRRSPRQAFLLVTWIATKGISSSCKSLHFVELFLWAYRHRN